MKNSELTEFEIEEEGFKLSLRRKNGEPQIIQAAPMPAAPVASAAPPAPSLEMPAATKPPVEEKGISIIKSPMVGTFYAASSPDNPPFVKVGGKVSSDTVVCIIEAMKVMNEIHADMKGSITEVLVENGSAVEYGQPLFKVKTT